MTDELVTVGEARRTTEEALTGEGGGAVWRCPGDGTPLDGDHVRVQVVGVRVRRESAGTARRSGGRAGPTGADE